MKYKVKISGKSYEVELNDLHNQPIIALVNGEPVEVWLETEMGFKPYFATPELAEQVGKPLAGATVPTPIATPEDRQETTDLIVTAPIPGVIISVVVKPGDQVNPGQALCVLEAMKMKNTIRAARTGKIAKVNIQVGQAVQHQDVLLEYETQ